MASNDNIDCTLATELDVLQDVAIVDEALDVELITSTDEDSTAIPILEVELNVTQWSLVSDAIFIKNITGEEPQWFKDMVDDIIRENDDLLTEFEDIMEYITALENGYTNLVSITDEQATSLVALKVSSAESTAAITELNNVKITADQASAISSEAITAWMRGGLSGAWFNSHVQAVATDTSANTLAIIQLGAEVDGIESSVTEVSQALVEKYENPEWVGPGDPDPEGERQWIYEARAKHSLEVNANGAISGFIATAESCDPGIPGCTEGARSAFKIYADEFMICDKLDPNTNEPGTVAFLVRFSDLGEPTITLNGDVYFGNMPNYTGTEYTLYDIAMDSVVDPVEKTALEKMYKELVDRDSTFDVLVYQSTGRYHGLVGTHGLDTAEYIRAFGAVSSLVALLGIRGFSPSPEDPYLPTKLSDISLDRDGFNDIFFDYDAAYTKLNELMSNLVKQVADDSYNIMVNIFEDNIVSASEKVQLNIYLAQIEAMYNSIEPGITHPDCVAYPGSGFEEFSRYGVTYSAFAEYGSSIYAVDGEVNDPTCPCVPTPCPDRYYLLNGIITQMAKPVYDLANESVDTAVSESDAAAALASTRWFVDSRADYTTAVAGASIDTSFVRVSRTGDDSIYTLITEDIISTGEIGEHAYYGSGETRIITENYINFKVGTIHLQNDLDNPPRFIIDSEANENFAGICDSANRPNIRGGLIEGARGSFGTLYYGDAVAMAGQYIVKNTSFRHVSETISIYQLGDEELFTQSARFYSPTYPIDTPEVNDHRIKKLSSTTYSASVYGGLLDRLSLSDVMKIELTLEYNTDDSNWVTVPHQIEKATSSQLIIFDNIHCNNYVDFRLKIKYKSTGFSFENKQVAFTVAIKN